MVASEGSKLDASDEQAVLGVGRFSAARWLPDGVLPMVLLFLLLSGDENPLARTENGLASGGAASHGERKYSKQNVMSRKKYG